MIVFALFGIIFSVCALIIMKPLLVYSRLEFDMLYFLEVVKLICFIMMFIGEIVR